MNLLKRELEKVYDEYRQQLFSCALAVTRCPDLAEDAMHEAFCRLFRLTTTPSNLKAYVFRSVRNAAVDLIRQNHRLISVSDDYIFITEDNPRENAARNQFKQRVADGLLKLTEDERETIVQHLYGDLTFREIAELRDIPIGTITSWYHRGITRLRDMMEE